MTEIQDVKRLGLQPGDRLVVAVPDGLSMAEADAVKARLAEVFPGLPVLVHPQSVSVSVVESESVLRYFAYDHLPPALQAVSKPCHDLAQEMTRTLPAGPQVAAGLHRLLEAKDCFVRAALP